jgi:hypothetical protein
VITDPQHWAVWLDEHTQYVDSDGTVVEEAQIDWDTADNADTPWLVMPVERISGELMVTLELLVRKRPSSTAVDAGQMASWCSAPPAGLEPATLRLTAERSAN